MKLNRRRIFFVIYIIILLLFSIYSYSQIDLNLTLSANSIYQSFQKQLIQLGYFNRSLSTVIYSILIFALFIFYFLFLWLVEHKKLTKSNILALIIASSLILFFAYPAFSHDIFNYMFDARIVTKYHLNPYFYTALDFPNDLWTRFMHWTHRLYPYGPIWLLITLPFSYLGFEKFVLSLLNFKLMFTLFHFGNIYLIYKILKKVSPKNTLLGITFYAFNPLILIESLVSPHNEVVMLFFLLWAIYLIVAQNNKLMAIVNLLLSVGVKFATLILLPFFLLSDVIPNLFRDPIKTLKQVQGDRSIILILVLYIPVLFIQSIYREPYPWYFITLVGITALMPQNNYLKFIILGVSFGAMLRYIPYLYYGDYASQVKFAQNVLFVAPIILSLTLLLFSRLKKAMSYNG